MATQEELIDELIKGYRNPEEVLGKEGLFGQLKKALIERMLAAEMTEHLGYERGADKPNGTSNQRHGYSAKTVITEDGSVALEIPRDKEGTLRQAQGRLLSRSW